MPRNGIALLTSANPGTAPGWASKRVYAIAAMLRFTSPGTRRSMFFAIVSSAGVAPRRGITRCVRSGLRIASPPSAPGAAAVWRRRAKTSWISERRLTSGMRGPAPRAAAPSARVRHALSVDPIGKVRLAGQADRQFVPHHPLDHRQSGGWRLGARRLAVIPHLAVVLLRRLQRAIEPFQIGRLAVQQNGARCQHANLE